MGMIKKLTVSIVVLLLTFYILPASLAGVSKTLSSMSEKLNILSSGKMPYSGHPKEGVPPLSTPTHDNSSAPSPSVNLKGGVYNLSQFNDTLKKDILDPSKWYIGNTSLSSKYAFGVYNDTLKAVENATKTSESILQKFLGLFGDSSKNSSLVESTLESVERFLNSTTKFLKSQKR